MEHCTLCPRRCGARRTAEAGNGFCRLPETMRIARIAPHLWEEPPISGERGTGAVFFSGCTLRCVYCQNAEISHGGAGRPFTPAQLADALRRLTDTGVQSISFITATPFVPQILETLSLYRPPLPLVWNTSGYEAVETLRLLEGAVDVYLPDLKHFTPALARLCCGAADYFPAAAAAIREMVRQTGAPQYDASGIVTRGTLIRHLILPGATGDAMALLDWVADTFGTAIPVSLMRQYTPMPGVNVPGLNRRITPREYHRVLRHLEDLGLPGFTQEADSAREDFIPLFNRPGSFPAEP